MLASRHQLLGVGCPLQVGFPLRRLRCRLQTLCGAGADALPSHPPCSAAKLRRRRPQLQQPSSGQQPRMCRIPSASALCTEPPLAGEPRQDEHPDAPLPDQVSLEEQLDAITSRLQDLEALTDVNPRVDQYSGTEVDRAYLEHQWSEDAAREDAARQRTAEARTRLPHYATPRKRRRSYSNMPLQKAPGIQVAVAESEPRPAVVRAELETLERAYTAESVNRRPGATRRARVSAWGRVKADVSTGAGKSEQKVASGEDVLNSFVKRASNVKLLSGDEEKELGRDIQQLSALKLLAVELEDQLGREPSMSECAIKAGLTTEELRKRYTVGQASKQRMMDCNLRLVISVARKYLPPGRGNTLPLEDLVAEGVTGLSAGIDRFDPSRGFKLSTYVHWWIRQAVMRCVQDEARVVRLPVHLHDLIGKIRKTELLLFSRLNRRATQPEIAQHLGLTLDRLRLVNKAARQPTSTAHMVGGEGDDQEATTLEDTLEDTTESSSPRETFLDILQDNVDNVLHTLSPRECGVLRMRYGLDGEEERTLEEIGEKFKVTRERIRQIECKALRKLKHTGRLSAMEKYEAIERTPMAALMVMSE